MPSQRVLITYNLPTLATTHPDAVSEHEVLETIREVEQVLVVGGFEVLQLGIGRNLRELIDGVEQLRPDAVFNLYEGTPESENSEALIAGILEWLGVPFTGCPAQALAIGRKKHLTKTLLRGARLATPGFLVVDRAPVEACSLGWPVIVKPATQDASVGVDQGSVVTDQWRLNERVSFLLERYGPPILIEEYIHGREFNVAVIEYPDLQVLPITEILFVDHEPGKWPILTFTAKWHTASSDYQNTPPRYTPSISPRLAEAMSTLSRKAFRLLGCRDYTRVDFRVKPSGKPYILEVNPNPDIHSAAGFSGAMNVAGVSHADFMVHLVRAAIHRGQGAFHLKGRKPSKKSPPAVIEQLALELNQAGE